MFARYAFPPNELGYCGPEDSDVLLHGANPAEVATHARGFDGAWPYLRAISEETGSDPLADDVVRGYWVGGPLLDRVDPAALLEELRSTFHGQVTGLLDAVTPVGGVLANHAFHVFMVYPWVRYLDRNTETALGVLQNCRIRWGTVQDTDSEHVLIESSPLVMHNGRIGLGAPAAERVRWCRDGASLIHAPAPGDSVSAHWDWVCDILTDSETRALADATHTTLDLANRLRPGTPSPDRTEPVVVQPDSKGGRQ